jgi:thiol-disulfide isomerase/thioredoxin
MLDHASARGPVDTPPADPAERLAEARMVIRRTGNALEVARKKPQLERNEAEIDRARSAFATAMDAGMETANEIMKADPSSDAGLDACDLLLTQRMASRAGVPAIEAVTRFHAADPRIGAIVARVGYYNRVPSLLSYRAGTVLFDAVEKVNTDRTVRAQLAMARARRAELRMEIAEIARQPGKLAPFTQKAIGAVRAEVGSDLEPDQLANAAIAEVRAVVHNYGDVPDLHDAFPPPKILSLREAAVPMLRELEHLRVGSLAPTIQGVDLEGRPFKLTDARGKVVLLVFWASWCGPCMAAVPHERELSEKFAGRPFALVGVNGDEDREHGLAVQKEKRVAGRSFWNGPDGAEGPISKAWNVKGWPTVYVIDASGRIRYKDLLDGALDGPLDQLVAEAEAATTTRAPLHQAR